MASLEKQELVSDRYRVVRLVGQGSMGSVYEAEHVQIQRRVALKVLHAKFQDDDDIVERFTRESRAAARIGSRHIVEVLDVGKLKSGQPFIVMEFLAGESLRARVRRERKMRIDDLFPLAIQLLNGLHAAHAAGILHRDIKPDNVFVVPEGAAHFVKLLDFGISKFHFENEELTSTGMVMGTPRYMAPEQALGERAIDRRADLFSVGAVLFKGLSGAYAYEADSPSKLLFKTALTAARSLTTVLPEVDPQVAAIVDKSLARDPKDRYQHAVEMAHALGDCLAARSRSLPRAAQWYRDAPVPDLDSAPLHIADDATMNAPLDKLEMSALGDAIPGEMTEMTATTTVNRDKKRWPTLAVVALAVVCAIAAFIIWGPFRASAPTEAAVHNSLQKTSSSPSSASVFTAGTATPTAGPSGSTAVSSSTAISSSAAAPASTAAVASAAASQLIAPRLPLPKSKAPRLKDDRPFRPSL